MSTYSICIILNHGIVLETFPIESRLIFPNGEDMAFLKELLQIRVPEEMKYKIDEFLKLRRIETVDLYYNNKNYGLYGLMDFTNDILTKHKANNIYVLEGWDYTRSTAITMNNCSALIWKTDDVTLYSTVVLSYQILSQGKNNVVISVTNTTSDTSGSPLKFDL